MKQKIISILNEHKIYYTESGANVKSGNLNLKCPWCGEDDPSEHMGVNISDGSYGCWRNSRHRGKELAFLIQALTRCSLSEARMLISVDRVTLQKDGILKQVVDTLTVADDGIPIVRMGGVKELKLRDDFYWADGSKLRIRFQNYLIERGFKNRDKLEELIMKYSIGCCLVGEYKFRLIFPIYYKGHLVSWTSRSIYPDATLRYKDLSIEESVRHVKFCLYNYDDLLKKGGKKLFVVEGPLDVLKLEYFFPDEDYRATCFFTTSMQSEQIYLLSLLSKKFDKVILLLDKGVESQMLMLRRELGFIRNIKFQYLPENVNDPGEMLEEEVRRLL